MEAALASILAASAPLIFATIGEAITEKSGVINLSLDGSILLSAMAALATAYTTGSVWLGFVAAMIFTLLLVYSDSIGRLLDRLPALRGILRSDPPSALGTHFEQE